MFAVGVPELLVLLVLLVAGAGVLLLLAGTAGGRVVVHREYGRVRATRALGVVLGVALAAPVWGSGSYGRGPMLAPAVFGLVVLAAAALGETVVRPHREPGVRTASLAPRRVRDHLPPVLGPVVAALVVASAALLTLTTFTADRDPGTGTMRALSCETATSGSTLTSYPGSYYSLPLAGVLLLVLGLAWLAAGQAVRRPRGLADSEAGETALRRRSVAVVVGATGVAVGAPLVGVALVAGGALLDLAHQPDSCAAGWMPWVGYLCLLLALVAALVVVACTALLLVGGPRHTRARAEVGATWS